MTSAGPETFALMLPRLLSLLILAAALAAAQSPNVVVIPIKGTIELGVSAFLSRAVDDAIESGAAGVVVDLDTLGGRIDAALEMQEALLRAAREGLSTVCYVHPKAISAGALVALSCRTIIVAPSAIIGAAEPVMVAPTGTAAPVSEKEISFVRSTFRTAAQASGHSPRLAEAMVDADIEVWLVKTEAGSSAVDAEELKRLREDNPELAAKELSPAGKLLTLTADEALEAGLASWRAESLEEALAQSGLAGAVVTTARPTWSEVFARVVTNPIVAGLLLMVGLAALYIEFKVPGFGLPGTVGIICITLFFLGSYVAGLAQFSDIILFAVGTVLLLTEILLIPGFGITGVSGITLMLLGLALAMVKQPLPRYSWEFAQLARAVYAVGGAMVGTVVFAALAGKFLPKTPFWDRITLTRQMRREDGFSAQQPGLESLRGKTGVARTNLRPAGVAEIDGKPVDVVTEGDMLDLGTRIVVVQVEGNRVVVKRAKEV